MHRQPPWGCGPGGGEATLLGLEQIWEESWEQVSLLWGLGHSLPCPISLVLPSVPSFLLSPAPHQCSLLLNTMVNHPGASHICERKGSLDHPGVDFQDGACLTFLQSRVIREMSQAGRVEPHLQPETLGCSLSVTRADWQPSATRNRPGILSTAPRCCLPGS